MPEGFIVSLLFKIAPSLLIAAAKAGVQSLLQQNSVTKAIEATCAIYPGLEPLRHTLSTWCKSNKFGEILEQIKAGNPDISQEYIITSFIENGGFYAANDTRVLAEQVLNTFAVKLQEQLFSTDQATYFLGQRQEVLHSQTHNQIARLDEHIATMEQKLLSRLPASEDQNQTRSASELTLHTKLDVARDLLNQGKPGAARAILDELRKTVTTQSVSDEILFRLATNLGACSLRFNDYESANKEFATALNYKPTSVKALANMALGKLALNKKEEGLLLSKQARQIDGRDPHATSIYIRALHELNRSGDIENLIREEKWVSQDPICALTLASIRYEERRYDGAELLARTSLNGSPNEVQTLLLIAQAIITPIQKELHQDPPLRWRLREQTQRRLIEAETLIDQAIDLLRNQDIPERLNEAIEKRAVVRIMLGRYEDALSDCDRILADAPSHEIALGNKALTLLKLRRTKEAIKILERLKFDPESSIPLASAYVEDKEPEKAIAILRPMFQPDMPEDRQFEIADTLLSAYYLQFNIPAAEDIITSIVKSQPNNAQGQLIIARYRQKQGRNDEAIALLREGITSASDNLRDVIILELADVYYSLNRYSDAAELYEKIVDKTSDSTITRKYLISLFNAGSYRETLVLAQSLRGSRDAIPVVTELEALVMQNIGDLDRAIELFEKLSQVEPQNLAHRVRLALLHLRRGNRIDAKHLLSNIEPPVGTDSRTLLQIAQARDFLGMSDVLPLAYRARRLAPRDPEVHLAYIGLFLRREHLDSALLNVDQITPGCTVRLKSSDHVQIFTIMDSSESNVITGELLPLDPLAIKLLGHKTGDYVVLREGLEDLSYEIIDVQSKYVFAFQDTLINFSTWFPDHTGLFKVDLKDDFSKIKLALDTRERFTSQVLSLYQDKNLTLGAFSRIVGTPLIGVWAGLITKHSLLASTGIAEETHREVKLLARATEIVVDQTAILTLAHLDLLECLPSRFNAILVSQALVDEIDQALTRDFLNDHPAMSVWKEDETYFRKEITPEDHARNLQFLESIRAFLQTRTKVTPTRGVLDLGKTKFEQVQDLLGNESISAILLAKERGLILYSDDLGLRSVAKNDWQVSGFWTQSLLLDLRDKGLLTEEQYREAVKKLLLSNYRFVSIDAAGLFWVLNEAGFTSSLAVTRVFESLHGPDCSDESALIVLSDLIKRIWVQPLLDHRKFLLLDLVLDTLTTGRDPDRALTRFKVALEQQFILISHLLPRILQQIDRWNQQRKRGSIIRS